jgi:hypothetical protein
VAARTRCVGLLIGALALWALSASARDLTCFESADAVRRQYPGAWPSWTLRAAGQEGRKCWYASTRASARDHKNLIAVDRITEAAETVEPSTKRFELQHEIASPPQPVNDAVRLEGAPEPGVRIADAGEESFAVTSSIASVPATHPVNQITDRPIIDARPADAGTAQPLEQVRQLSVAASAPARDEHLPVWKVLAIFVAALALASIAARTVFRNRGVRLEHFPLDLNRGDSRPLVNERVCGIDSIRGEQCRSRIRMTCEYE